MNDNDLEIAQCNQECNQDGICSESKRPQARKSLAVGNVIWIQVDNGIWWPAQVVEEKHAIGSKRAQKKKVGKVFVRLYGSYEYLHVDPSKYNCRFENVLKLHNYNRKDVFLKSLAKELSLLNSEDDKASEVADTGSNACIDNGLKEKRSRNKQHISDNINTNGNLRTPKRSKIRAKLGKDIDLSNQPTERSRPTKMMQMLGLVAPTDSPFRKNGTKSTISFQL